jgi:hypothetical protein
MVSFRISGPRGTSSSVCTATDFFWLGRCFPFPFRNYGMVLLSNLAIGHDSFTINGLHVRGSVRKHLGLRPHNCTCRQPAILEAFANSLIISRRNICFRRSCCFSILQRCGTCQGHRKSLPLRLQWRCLLIRAQISSFLAQVRSQRYEIQCVCVLSASTRGFTCHSF